MAEDRREQLEALITRRDQLRDSVSNITGRLEAAQDTLGEIKDECKKRKVAPDQLDGAINQLEERFDQEVQALDKRIETAEASVQPFLEEA